MLITLGTGIGAGTGGGGGVEGGEGCGAGGGGRLIGAHIPKEFIRSMGCCFLSLVVNDIPDILRIFLGIGTVNLLRLFFIFKIKWSSFLIEILI